MIEKSVRYCQTFGCSAKYGKLLSNMAAEFGNPLIIEFGTSFGISTMYLAASVPETLVLHHGRMP